MKQSGLWEMSPDELELHLLAHGRGECASANSQRLALTGALASAGAALTVTSSASGPVASILSRAVRWLTAKWLAVGTASSALILGTAVGWPHWRASHLPSKTSLSHQKALTLQGGGSNVRPKDVPTLGTPLEAPDRAPASASGDHSVALPSLPQGALIATDKQAGRSPGRPPEPRIENVPSSSLREEIGLLQQARRALEAQAPASATAALDRYDQRFPAGRLRIEAMALRVETQFASGRRQTGEAMARAFLAQYPKSPAALRVQRLVGSNDDAPKKP